LSNLIDAQLISPDVLMPEMDVIITLSRLRKIPQTAGTPVIFMTVEVQPDEVDHYMRLGTAAVIAKPFDPMKLISEIEQNWAQYYGK